MESRAQVPRPINSNEDTNQLSDKGLDRGSDHDWLATSLTALKALTTRSISFDKALNLVAMLATWAVDQAEGAAINWLIRDSEVDKGAATHKFAWHLDQQQFATGKGPSAQALREQQIAHGHITYDLNRSINIRSARQPKHAVISVPVFVGIRIRGVLRFYASPDRDLDDSALAVAALFTEHAGQTLPTVLPDEFETTQTAKTLESRVVMEHAKGILMATQGYRPDEAAAQLEATARRWDISLLQVATRLVKMTWNRTDIGGPRGVLPL